MRKHKNKVIAFFAVLFILILAFWWGGNAPGLQGMKQPEMMQTTESEAPSEKPILTETPMPTETPSQTEMTVSSETPLPSKTLNISEAPILAETTAPTDEPIATKAIIPTEALNRENSPMPQNTNPPPIEPENAELSSNELHCTFSVTCRTILDNISLLGSEKAELVPPDGVIFSEREVIFYEGESVFNLLLREMKKSRIHLEFVNTPIYNSAYIEGINNIYEFDCGELSGWMYKVNEWYPNYGSSRYQLKDGDKVEWIYTCALGRDIGGEYAGGQQKDLR